jgi:hypothetical protein
VALGRIDDALETFDLVAASSGSPRSRLQAAQWRVVPVALGLVGFPAALADEGRALLEALSADSSVRAAAEWTLAVDAYGRNEPLEGQRHLAAIKAAAPSRIDLIAFIDALQQEALDRPDRALRITDSIVPYWAEGALEPFLRSALFLKRGSWRVADGQGDPASEWSWYQNSDLRGWAEGPTAQAGEIDWALANHARLRLAGLVQRRARARTCVQLELLTMQWAHADAPFVEVRDGASRRWRDQCR